MSFPSGNFARLRVAGSLSLAAFRLLIGGILVAVGGMPKEGRQAT